jgi:flagellar biosynthesis protein FlhA
MQALLNKLESSLGRFKNHTDLIFVAWLFGTVSLLVLPIPKGLLDLLLVFSVAISLLVLLTVIYIKNPPEFSVFPTLLLAVTLYRLGLNIASTRLILGEGDAGAVIDAFGNFVVKGNYIVGAVVFLILVIINFIVITKGAGRIAEVTARFTLDALPGKQMSIDAELNAGLISEDEATRKRVSIQKEADFYGAMDGASKFVRGDAVAGIFITLINVVGGILIGKFQQGLSFGEALQKFTLLSIGDGLVTQIPAIIISVAAGILVTRSSEESNLGSFVGKQLTIYPRAIAIAGAMLFIFAILPGMPFWPFFILSIICFYASYLLQRIKDKDEDGISIGKVGSKVSTLPGGGQAQLGDGGVQVSGAGGEIQQGAVPQNIKKAIEVDVFAIEMGYGLLSLADRKRGGDLLDRITGCRTNFTKDMGMIIPTIAVRDNIELEANAYRFVLRNKEIASGTIVPDRYLAMDVTGNAQMALNGIETIEPVFGLKAQWISEEEKTNAEVAGYTVVDASSVMVTHLSDVLKENGHLILEREGTQQLIDMVREKNSTLISELLPDLVNVGLIQRVLQNLLREKISIKNLTLILETIADYASATKNPDDLSEQARRKLGMYFVPEYESEHNVIQALTIEPSLEQVLISRVQRTQFEIGLAMDPMLTQSLLQEMAPKINEMAENGLPPLIVTAAELRLAIRRFFEPTFPRLAVLAFHELPNQTEIRSYGTIQLPQDQLRRGGLNQNRQAVEA